MKRNLVGLLLVVSSIAVVYSYHRPSGSGRALACRGRTILDAGNGLSRADAVAVLGIPEPVRHSLDHDFGFSLVYRSPEFSHRELHVRLDVRDVEKVVGLSWWGPRPAVLASGPFFLGDLPVQQDLWQKAARRLKFKLVDRGPEGILNF